MLKAVHVCIVAIGIIFLNASVCSGGSDYYDAISPKEPSEAVLTTEAEVISDEGTSGENGEEEKASKEISEKSVNDYVGSTSTRVPLEVRPRKDDGEVLVEQSDVSCGAPPHIEGAIAPLLEGSEHRVGTTVSYNCNFGYASRGSTAFLSSCIIDEQTGEAIWTNPDVSCVSRSCGDPGYVANARRIGNRFTFPNKVEFECEKGYKLRGLKARFCQASGDWSGRLPACELIYCSQPPDPENGRVLFSSLEFASELRYECNRGFVLKNHQLRLCTSDGTWSNDEPECIVTRCKIPESPERGSVQLMGDPKVGSLAVYSCNDDTMLYGTSTSKCMSSGEWTFDAPKCMRYCKITDVKDGEIGLYKTIRVSRQRTTRKFIKFQVDESIKHNDTVTLLCKSGFTPANRSKVTQDGSDEVMCIDGVWNKPMQCQIMSCLGEPPPIENGVAVIEDNQHGKIIWYRCNDDAVKAKSGRVICEYGTWKGYTPVCATTNCYLDRLNFPGLVKPQENVYKTETSFTVTCDNGYRKASSQRTIKCSNGKWDINDNPCVIETCENDPPPILNGRPVHFTRDQGSIVHYQCNEHFDLTGTSTVRCRGTQWEGEPPSCQEAVKSSRTTTPERTSTGHTSSGVAERINFTPSPTEDQICTCAYYYTTDLVSATVNNVRLEPGDRIERNQIVSLRCLHAGMILVWPNGLRLFGVVNIRCSACKIWDYHEVPTCETQQSGDTVIDYNEKMKILPGGVIEIQKNENIQIRCMSIWSQPIWKQDSQKPVYAARASQSSVTATGFYSSYMYIDAANYDHIGQYQCFTVNAEKAFRSTTVNIRIAEPDVMRCQELETNTRRGNFDIVYDNDRKVNTEAFYSCKDKTHKLTGANSRTCLESGKWSGSFPTCSADVTCPKFPTYNGLVVSYTNEYKANSIAKFSCSHHGTILVGSNSSVCQNNGIWSHPKPACEMLDIRCPVVDGKGIFDIFYNNDRRINSTAQFFCRAPNQKVDGCNFLTCQQNGEWFGSYPTCIDFVTCARFQASPGIFEVSYSDDVRVGSKASFRCLQPYTLRGVSSATCRNNGTWSHSPPFCEAPKCSIDTLMSNAPVGVILDEKEISEEFVPYGTELRLLCEDDSVLLGNSKATCEAEGKWKYANVQCVPGCRVKVDASSNLRIEPALEYYLFGDFVLLSCPPGQKLNTEVERIVCMGGSWSDDFPDCIEIGETTQSSPKETTRRLT